MPLFDVFAMNMFAILNTALIGNDTLRAVSDRDTARGSGSPEQVRNVGFAVWFLCRSEPVTAGYGWHGDPAFDDVELDLVERLDHLLGQAVALR